MIKKLTISAIILTVFITVPTSANAAFFDWADPGSDNAHPFIDGGSEWSISNLAKFELIKKRVPDEATEPVASPTPIPKTKTIRTNSIATHTIMASAYSSTPDQTDSTPFITAWNTRVRDGIIAANFLPFGTQIKIPELYGDKIFVVEDRMNRRYTYKIDIWFPEREQALEFGNKKVKIEVVARL